MAAVSDTMTVGNIQIVLPGPHTTKTTARIAVEEKLEAGGHLSRNMTTGQILHVAAYC